jgi:hypothetical protein
LKQTENSLGHEGETQKSDSGERKTLSRSRHGFASLLVQREQKGRAQPSALRKRSPADNLHAFCQLRTVRSNNNWDHYCQKN